MTIRWPLLIRRTHKWLALFIGIQVVLWTVTGMYMVAVHIDYIHGDHLVRAPAAPTYDLGEIISPTTVAALAPDAMEMRLQTVLNRPVWRVEAPAAPYLIDAKSGQKLPQFSEAEVREVARRIYTGTPDIVAVNLLTKAPMEMQSRKPPYWQVEFKGWNRPTLYISPTTGELISRRHNLWRIFDFAWMLHIMDYSERTDVNNPLLRVATWSAFLMALSGAWLLLWSFPRKKKKKS
ncbi:MAG: PepSY domain-containing protein [Pseudomonadota bacterium]